MEIPGGLTRRRFLTAAVAVAGTGAYGCASVGTVDPSGPVDSSGVGAPTVVVDYSSHFVTMPLTPAGIDISVRQGAPVTSPITGHVWQSGTMRNARGVDTAFITLESPLGHLVETTSHDEIYVAANDPVNPFTVIAKEGRRSGDGRGGYTGRSHVHVSVYPPVFAKAFVRDLTPFKVPHNELQLFLQDPNAQTRSGDIRNETFDGTSFDVDALVKEGEARLSELGAKHPRSLVADLLRISASQDIRFFPKVMGLYAARLNGMIDTPQLTRDVDQYFEWHSNLRIGLTLPYPSPAVHGYVRPTFDRERLNNLNRKWDAEIDTPYKTEKDRTEKLWQTLAERVKRYYRKSPFAGETGSLHSLGVFYFGSKAYGLSWAYSLLAEGMLMQKFDKPNPQDLKYMRYWNYRYIIDLNSRAPKIVAHYRKLVESPEFQGIETYQPAGASFKRF